MDLLVGYSENENISGWREFVIRELGHYIAKTVFLAKLLMGMHHYNPLTVSKH